MPTLLFILSTLIFSNMGPMVIDFGQDTGGADWRVLNDGVMGGLSQSTIKLQPDLLRFEGKISLENNGGFASMRSPYGRYDLSGYKALSMRVRGDRSSFGIVLYTSKTWFYPNYKKTFTAEPGEWQEIVFQLRDFDEYVVGRPQGRQMTDDELQRVLQFGIITNDKEAKDFVLEIDRLELR
jgi:NADH dehydrogenase [ubiquinone] 1 alpha subcomplex assembly factor 1